MVFDTPTQRQFILRILRSAPITGDMSFDMVELMQAAESGHIAIPEVQTTMLNDYIERRKNDTAT